MKEEKMLIKVEPENIFSRIINFIKNIFKKTKQENIIIEENKNKSFIDEFEEKRKVIEMQKEFEQGKIIEDDLNDEQIKQLEELYKEQIKKLKTDLESYSRTIQTYKEKILSMKKKLQDI